MSVNDVALAAVTGADRTILRRRGEKPTARKVRILVPVSTRPSDAEFVICAAPEPVAGEGRAVSAVRRSKDQSPSSRCLRCGLATVEGLCSARRSSPTL
ncbi:hypothetical protein ACWF82_22800 [Nocardia sp. NPDC055053]